MAAITINTKDEINKEFRDVVEKKLGHGKGVLGKAVRKLCKSGSAMNAKSTLGRKPLRP